MIKPSQSGAVALVFSFVLVGLLLVGAIGFGAWAYSSRQDYKTNVDAKINVAVGIAKQQEGAKKDAEFAEASKSPLKTYNGPQAYGSLVINFPKIWSAYIDDSGHGNAPVDGYFAPGAVPSISDQSSVFALRVQVLGQTYDQVVQQFSGQQQATKLTIAAYALPKVPKSVGVEVTGQLNGTGPNTTMVILPLRSQTLEISTQGNQYVNDFNTYILPNFSFSP